MANVHPSSVTRHKILTSPVVHLQVLLLLAISLGGGGAAYGLRNLVIMLFPLLLLALQSGLVVRFLREAPLAVRVLLFATLALPLLQLIPLPPALWQALPGRETILASHVVAGLGDSLAFPLSLDRARTLVAFTGLIVPATVVILGTMLPLRDRLTLGWTFVILALAAMMFGVVPLQAANTAGLLYPITPAPDVLYATFANRNSTGLLLVIALILTIAITRTDNPRQLLAATVIALLLLIGVILTKSRSSIILLAAPLAFLAMRLIAHVLDQRRQSARRESNRQHSAAPKRGRPLATLGVIATLAVVLLAGAVTYSTSQGGRVAASLARFQDGIADRPEMWEDGLYAAGQYWPAGSGTGTFDEVFQVHESLEFISPRRAGRAHSDWIELAMESGLAGLALAAGWLLWVGVSGVQHLLRAGPHGWLGLGAGVAAGCIALQSLVDYPLRNQTLLCAAGLLVAILVFRRNEDAA